MTDSTPTSIEFSQFVQGINAIKSKNKQFRFNPKIMADLKASAVYQFFIASDYFSDALENFLSCRYIKNNPVIRAELSDQSTYDDYVVLSLMGIAAEGLRKYFHAKTSPAASTRVVTKKEKKPSIAACDHLLEKVINHRLVSLPSADYMTLERLLVLVQKMLSDEEYSQFPERVTGIPYIWERELVYDLTELYGKEYGDSRPGIIASLARIVLDEAHSTMLDKWIRAGRKRYLIIKKLNSISRQENKVYDNYYR